MRDMTHWCERHDLHTRHNAQADMRNMTWFISALTACKRSSALLPRVWRPRTTRAGNKSDRPVNRSGVVTVREGGGWIRVRKDGSELKRCGLWRRCSEAVRDRAVTLCNNLHHTAKHCNTGSELKRCGLRHRRRSLLQHPATPCNTLQHTAALCNSLQLTATHCEMHVAVLQWSML